MGFDRKAYGPAVDALLGLESGGERLMPLVCDASAQVAGVGKQIHQDLFSASRHPKAALAGLWVYFSYFEAAHEVAQDDSTAEGSYWHAILHRQEPDDFNSGYWFRRLGKSHPVFVPLAEAAAGIAERNPGCGFRVRGTTWDAQAFIEYCATARSKPGSIEERTALQIQRAEWQILFDYCASPGLRKAD
jgi:hypothetical protein